MTGYGGYGTFQKQHFAVFHHPKVAAYTNKVI